jgi:hypothetical protein
MMVFSIVSGQITAHTGRYKFLPVIGTALMVTAALLFAFRLNADMPLWETDIYMVIFGAGLGLCMQTLSLAAQNSVPARDMGVATSTSTSFRQLGGTLGVAVFFSVLFSTVGGKIASAFASAAPTPSFQAAINDPTVVDNPANKPVLDMLHGGGFGGGGGGVLQDASFLRTIDPRLAHPFFVGFSNAMMIVFICAAAIAAIALVLFAFMKEVPLRQYSGLQEAAMEQAAIADGGEQPAPATAARPVAEVPAEETMRLPVAAGAPGLRSPSAQNGHAAVATRPVRDENLVAPQGGGTPIRGQVRRPDGSGIAGATLTLIDAAGRQVARGIARGEGGYGMGAPGPGTFVLIASAGSHQPTASTVVVGSGPVDLDVVLTATAGLTGVVRAADGGASIAGATTTLADGRGEVVSSQLTGAAGEYTFSDLMEGSYTLVVSAQAHRPNASMVTVSGTGQTHQDVELVTAARLRGAALIGDSDRRVIDARITLLDAGGNVVAVANTDETGEYSFDDLVAGEYTVVASGFPVVTSTLRTVGGEVSQHDVKFSHTQ